MPPEPLYRASELTPAFALRYTWCGWATAGDLRVLSADGWAELQEAWEKDNLRLLERKTDENKTLLTFSTKPVGTFGEYNMRAIREAVREESYSPATRGGRGPTCAGDYV